MTEEYVKRLLAFWQSAKQDCQRKIDRYENGERNALLDELYWSGSLHEGLKRCEEKNSSLQAATSRALHTLISVQSTITFLSN